MVFDQKVAFSIVIFCSRGAIGILFLVFFEFLIDFVSSCFTESFLGFRFLFSP